MADNTTNNEFRTPEVGDTDYEDSFNTFFEQIDRAVEIRDTDSNRSTYDPKDNAKYFATDTEDVYIGDGTNWVHVTSSGKDPVFNSVEGGTVTATSEIVDAAGSSHTGQLADDGDAQPPESHNLGGSQHTSDTLANLNAKVSDATLDDDGDSRPPQSHDNTAHSTNYSPQGHNHSGESINPDSVSADDATVNNSLTDASGTSHTGELADLADTPTVVKSGLVTLSSGSAIVSTGVTTGADIDVRLDASGDGNNTADVKASARAFWDNSAGEHKVEILEDGTSVGNPDIGYKVIQ